MTRHDTTGRTRRVLAVSAATVLTTGLIATAASADPDVTAEDVREAMHALSAANEEINAISEDIDRSSADIEALEKDIAAQQREYDQQREVLAQSVVQQQMDAPLGATVSLFGSEDPEAFIDGLGAKLALDTTQAQRLQSFADLSRALENRRTALEDRKAELVQNRESLQERQERLEAEHREVEAQLRELNAAERATATGADQSVQLADIDLSEISGRGAQAVAFARAQLGDRYVYGGTGPDAWDCSGLTQGAWAAAGVSIPRVAGAQFAAGQSIPLSAVQPGDLVFYGDMSHTGIYVGGGQVIHAANPRRPVEVTSIGAGFTQAARVG